MAVLLKLVTWPFSEMLGAAFFITSGVMLQAVLCSRASWVGVCLAAVVTVFSVTIDNWVPVAAAATALFCVIAATPVRTAGDVSLAIFVAALSAVLALQSEQLGIRMAYIMQWDAELSTATVIAVSIGLSFAAASAAHDDLRLLPFACIGAAALPLSLLPVAAIWVAAGVTFLVFHRLRGPGALVVSSAAVIGAFVILSI